MTHAPQSAIERGVARLAVLHQEQAAAIAALALRNRSDAPVGELREMITALTNIAGEIADLEFVLQTIRDGAALSSHAAEQFDRATSAALHSRWLRREWLRQLGRRRDSLRTGTPDRRDPALVRNPPPVSAARADAALGLVPA